MARFVAAIVVALANGVIHVIVVQNLEGIRDVRPLRGGIVVRQIAFRQHILQIQGVFVIHQELCLGG